jgi:hypothetical protein
MMVDSCTPCKTLWHKPQVSKAPALNEDGDAITHSMQEQQPSGHQQHQPEVHGMSCYPAYRCGSNCWHVMLNKVPNTAPLVRALGSGHACSRWLATPPKPTRNVSTAWG